MKWSAVEVDYFGQRTYMMRRLVDHETFVGVSLNSGQKKGASKLTARFVLVPVPSSEVVGTMNGVLKGYQLVETPTLVLLQLTKSHSK
jgi:hypothetical protein